MSKRQFLLDRWPYLLCYALSLGLVLLIVQLDLWQAGTSLRLGNVLYIGVLSSLLMIGWLLYDYYRQRAHFQELVELWEAEGVSTHVLPELAVTHEQQLHQELLKQQHLSFAEALTGYRERQELRVHFLNRWVHQMKTPVSVMDLLLQELEQAPTSDTVAENLREELDKVAAGLDLMLQSSRLEDFDADFSIQQVNLLDLVRQVVNEQKKLFIRARVYPRVQAPVDQIPVETDAKWLRFVLLQLLVNAVKYSRPEGGQAAREVVIALEPGEVVRVTVRDSGIGIPEHDLPRIFEPFFTGENGRRFPQATGIGLYLSKQVLDRLGHRITVNSKVDVGSSFTISFHPAENLHTLVKQGR